MTVSIFREQMRPHSSQQSTGPRSEVQVLSPKRCPTKHSNIDPAEDIATCYEEENEEGGGDTVSFWTRPSSEILLATALRRQVAAGSQMGRKLVITTFITFTIPPALWAAGCQLSPKLLYTITESLGEKFTTRHAPPHGPNFGGSLGLKASYFGLKAENANVQNITRTLFWAIA